VILNRRELLKLSGTAALLAAAGVIPFDEAHAIDISPPSLFNPSKVFNPEYFKKIREFNKKYSDDFVLNESDFITLKSCARKLRRLQSYIGYGNFNIVNYGTALYYMKRSSRLEKFSKSEFDFINAMFDRDAKEYGFFGEKIFTSLYDKVKRRHVVKIPRTGHYLYKGSAVVTHDKIVKDMGTLKLTSGVRSVVKQMYLFIAKAVETEGNLSMASRSIAPVGYSYHGMGDFDVGIKTWGYENFTEKFATTDEYRKLLNDGYMRLRYDLKNPYGVRFEPWHVKVI